MKMLLQIAWRNLMRNKRRTFLSALTIAVGMMYFSLMDSMMDGMDKGAIDNMVELSTGALKIQTREYEADEESFPFEYGIVNVQEITETLRKDKRVRGITTRTVFLGQLSNYEDMYPVKGIVVDPDHDSTVFSHMEFLEGDYFGDDSESEIILGSGIAKDFDVEVGGVVTLYAQTKYETRNASDFTVVGILNTTDPSVNTSSVFLSRKAGDEFLDLEGFVSEMNVSLHDRNTLNELLDDMEELQVSLRGQFPDHIILTFRETGAEFIKMMESKTGFGFVMLGVILFIAAVGIFNTVLMSVYERVREIGVLRAHGMVPKDLMRLFMLEGLYTGIIGACFGFLLSLGVVALIVIKGMNYEGMMNGIDMAQFPISMHIFGVWNIPQIVVAGIFSIIVATAAAVIPARKAGKMSVTDALRFN